MPPVSARDIGPPLKIIVQLHRVIGGSEDNRSRNQILRRSAGIVFGARLPLSDRHIACRLHKLLELRIRHIGLIHEESVDVDAMNWPRIHGRLHAHFVHVWRILRTHRKLAARYPNHPRWRARWRSCTISHGWTETHLPHSAIACPARAGLAGLQAGMCSHWLIGTGGSVLVERKTGTGNYCKRDDHQPSPLADAFGCLLTGGRRWLFSA